MKKKLLGFVSALLLVMSLFVFPVFAQTTNYSDTLTDIEKIELIQYGDCTYDAANGTYTFTMQQNTPALRSANIGDRKIVQTSYIIIPITEDAKKNLPIAIKEIKLRGSGGENTVFGSDSAGCVDASLTITYDQKTKNGKDYVYLKNINGGYSAEGRGSNVGSGVSVTGNSVSYGQSGIDMNGRAKSQNKMYSVGTSNRNFSITPPSSWVPVAGESNVATVGATYTIKLKRGSSSWNCLITNNLSF